MVEVGDGAGFGQVGFGIFGPGDQLAVRHLDGHGAMQLLVVGQVDQAEAALAQQPLHPVAADPCGQPITRPPGAIPGRRDGLVAPRLLAVLGRLVEPGIEHQVARTEAGRDPNRHGKHHVVIIAMMA